MADTRHAEHNDHRVNLQRQVVLAVSERRHQQQDFLSNQDKCNVHTRRNLPSCFCLCHAVPSRPVVAECTAAEAARRWRELRDDYEKDTCVFEIDGSDVDYLPPITTADKAARLAGLMMLPTRVGDDGRSVRVPMRVLSLEDLKLGDSGVCAFVNRAIAQRQTKLYEIRLVNVGMKREGAIALARLIRMNPGITVIDVSHNDIGNDGITAIADAVCSPGDFAFTNTNTDSGMELEVEALVQNDDGTVEPPEDVAREIDIQPATFSACFHNCGIGPEGGMSVARLVQHKATSLVGLDLSHNPMGDEPLIAIARHIKQQVEVLPPERQLLEGLGLCSVGATADGAKAILRATARLYRVNQKDAIHMLGNADVAQHAIELVKLWKDLRKGVVFAGGHDNSSIQFFRTDLLVCTCFPRPGPARATAQQRRSMDTPAGAFSGANSA